MPGQHGWRVTATARYQNDEEDKPGRRGMDCDCGRAFFRCRTATRPAQEGETGTDRVILTSTENTNIRSAPGESAQPCPHSRLVFGKPLTYRPQTQSPLRKGYP